MAVRGWEHLCQEHSPSFRCIVASEPCIYRFGPYEFRPQTRELFKLGVKIRLRPQPAQILDLMLARAGDLVTRDELSRLLWRGQTDVDFNYGVNTSIKELRSALGDSASDPRCIETIPKLGYRFLMTVQRPEPAAQPVAPVVVREAPPEAPAGISGARPNRSAPASWSRLRPTLLGACVLLFSALLVWVLWSKSPTGPAPTGGRLMVAVLPFENLTGDAAQDYFSDGLTEEMIAQLGRADPQRLGVIARTSVMHYKSEKPPLAQIGRELGVAYVLEGSVRRDAARVRITVELVKVRDQASVWSRQYDRALSGLLDLQREIARDIARGTELAMHGGRPPLEAELRSVAAPNSYEAYDFYLKGRYFWNKRTMDGFQRAAGFFQQAIARDPHYGRAYAGLADTYALMSTWGFAPQNELMPRARAAALKALEIDDTVAEAHASLALIIENYDYDWPRAEQEFRRAIELDPGYATSHQWYAEYLSWQGRFDEALAESERARRLDPLSLIIATDHGAILYLARQYQRAAAQLRTVLEMDPGFDRARLLLVFAYVEQGGFAQAWSELTYRNDPDDSALDWALRAYVCGRQGRAAEAQQDLAKVRELLRHSSVDPLPPLLFAYLGSGHPDEAVALLQKAYSEHSNAIVGMKVAPYDDPLRGDPKFEQLLQRLRLAPAGGLEPKSLHSGLRPKPPEEHPLPRVLS